LSGFPASIINNSFVSAKGHEEVLGYRSGKQIIISNGFDTDVFSPSPQARLRLRSELGLSSDALLIGLVARFHPVKDHSGFLRAARLIQLECPHVHFVLAGQGVTDTNRDLRQIVAELPVPAHAHLLGEFPDVSPLLCGLDVVVLSSASEGFPNVIGEAMSCGVPCVVTNVGDSALLVGETGFVVPARDPEALAQALRTMAQLDHAERNRLGTLARQRIINNFSLDAIAQKYERLYEETILKTRMHAACAG
jgi:glycosyltransferase involved in cell wall biosynthesis